MDKVSDVINNEPRKLVTSRFIMGNEQAGYKLVPDLFHKVQLQVWFRGDLCRRDIFDTEAEATGYATGRALQHYGREWVKRNTIS